MGMVATEEPLFRQMSHRRPSDAFQKGYFDFCPRETWSPSVNLYETALAYVVCVDLAGVDKDKIDVVLVDHQRLQLRGQREVPVPQHAGDSSAPRLKVHVMEIDHGAFCRDVELPRDVDKDRVVATHANGLLWIELPKKDP